MVYSITILTEAIIIIIIIAYKAEIINIAEYLNTNSEEDQFVNIVKNHESTQPNMNSIIKSATKITEEISLLSGKSDAKQDEMQHTKERLGDVLKKKWENKVMHGQYIRNMDRQLLVKKTRSSGYRR